MQAVKGQDQTRQKVRDSEVSFQVLVEAVQDYAIFGSIGLRGTLMHAILPLGGTS